MEALCDPSPLSKYERERLARIEANRKRMEELGVLETARNLMDAINATKPQRTAPKKARKPKGIRPRPDNARRSGRLTGSKPQYGEIGGDLCTLEEAVTYSDYEAERSLHDLLAGGSDDGDVSSWEPKKQEVFQEIRCSSVARGSMYDSHAGITCHFCRQKKLCGEENCPRCSRRNVNAECIGKTECSRCQSANGRFCRACLLLRYGQTIEEAREQMAKGEWLCPHCYEEEHPHDGWMCNSSICMKRRGFKPTGIAIYDAQQRGFKSVGHWLQAQLKRKGGAAAVLASGGDAAADEAASGSDASAAAAGAASGSGAKGAAAASGSGAKGAAAVGKKGSRRSSAGAADASAAAAASTASADDVRASRDQSDSGRRRTRGSDAAAAAAAGKANADASPSAAVSAAPKRRGRPPKAPAAASSREGSSEPAAKRTAVAEEGARRVTRPRRA